MNPSALATPGNEKGALLHAILNLRLGVVYSVAAFWVWGGGSANRATATDAKNRHTPGKFYG